MDYITKLKKIEEATKLSDQTKIPQIDNLEVQAIRSILNDLRRDLSSTQDQLARKTQDIEDFKKANELQGQLLAQKDQEISNLKEQLAHSPNLPPNSSPDNQIANILQSILNWLKSKFGG